MSKTTTAERVGAFRVWLTIGELRGKILFVADPGYIADYSTAFPGLAGALMSTSDGTKAPTQPETLAAKTFICCVHAEKFVQLAGPISKEFSIRVYGACCNADGMSAEARAPEL